MEAIIFLSIIIALFSIFVSCLVIRRVKKQIAEITDALACLLYPSPSPRDA